MACAIDIVAHTHGACAPTASCAVLLFGSCLVRMTIEISQRYLNTRASDGTSGVRVPFPCNKT